MTLIFFPFFCFFPSLFPLKGCSFVLFDTKYYAPTQQQQRQQQQRQQGVPTSTTKTAPVVGAMRGGYWIEPVHCPTAVPVVAAAAAAAAASSVGTGNQRRKHHRMGSREVVYGGGDSKHNSDDDEGKATRECNACKVTMFIQLDSKGWLGKFCGCVLDLFWKNTSHNDSFGCCCCCC